MKAAQTRNNTDTVLGEEKRRIFREIQDFRKEYGIGCFKAISEATGGKIAVHTIAHMVSATRISNEVWVEVGQALEKLRQSS